MRGIQSTLLQAALFAAMAQEATSSTSMELEQRKLETNWKPPSKTTRTGKTKRRLKEKLAAKSKRKNK